MGRNSFLYIFLCILQINIILSYKKKQSYDKVMDKYYSELKKTIEKDPGLSSYSKVKLVVFLYDVCIEKCENEKTKQKLIADREKITKKNSFSPPLNLCDAYNLTHQDNKHDFGHGKTSLKYNLDQVNSLAAGDKLCKNSITNVSEIDYLKSIIDFYGKDEGYIQIQLTFAELNDPNNSIEEILKENIPNLDSVFCIIDTARPSFLTHISKTDKNVEKPFWWVCQTMQTLFDAAGKLNYFGFNNKNNYSIFNRDDRKNPNVGFCWEDPTETKITTYKKWPIDSLNGELKSQTNIPREMLDIKEDVDMFWNSEVEQTNTEEFANDFRNHSSCIYMKGPDGIMRWADTILASKTQNRQYSFFKVIKTLALQIMGISSSEKDKKIKKELEELKYREDFHFLSKRCGDMTQANACSEPYISLRTDYGGTIRKFRSNGIHNFVSYDSLAVASAMIYGSPIVTKCYSKNSSENTFTGQPFADGCSVYIRGDLIKVKQEDYDQLIINSGVIPEIINSFTNFSFEESAPKLQNVTLVVMKKGTVFNNWTNNLSDGVFVFDTSSKTNTPISQLPIKVLQNNNIWVVKESPVSYNLTDKVKPLDFKIFLYIYVFMLEYYKNLSKLELQYKEVNLLFLNLQFPITNREELINILMQQYRPRNLSQETISSVEFKQKKDLLNRIQKFGEQYKKLSEQIQIYRTSFFSYNGIVPYLPYSDLASKVINFDPENFTTTRVSRLTGIQKDKYMSYKEFLYPLSQGPFGYYNRYKSSKWGAPNNEYYNSLWLKINEIAMIEAIKTEGTGFQGQFYKDFDTYFPRTDNIIGNSFSPRPLDLQNLTYGVGLSNEIQKEENKRQNIIREGQFIPPRERIPFTDEDIYICILNSAVDILPFLKINTDEVTQQIEKYKDNTKLNSLEFFQISNVNIKYNSTSSKYRYRLFSDFLAFVGGVLKVELSKTQTPPAWATQETLNKLNSQYPGKITPETICGDDRADIYRLCFKERLTSGLSEVDLFYNYLLILCNIWDESISAVDFLINFMDKRINYLDFVTKPIDSDGKLNNGFGWTEETLDQFISFDGLYLSTKCMFYKYFVKDYLFYSGLIDFSQENLNTGITKFVIDNYPELLNIDQDGNYKSILNNIFIN